VHRPWRLQRFRQFFALTLTDGHAAIDQELCMGCGVCVSHCPQEALSLQRVPSKGEPLEISRLIQSFEEATPG
jgi:ferredoxin